MIPEAKSVWAGLDISFDDFIRTTESRHRMAVEKLVTVSRASGDIYDGQYEGWRVFAQLGVVGRDEVGDRDDPHPCGGQAGPSVAAQPRVRQLVATVRLGQLVKLPLDQPLHKLLIQRRIGGPRGAGQDRHQ